MCGRCVGCMADMQMAVESLLGTWRGNGMVARCMGGRGMEHLIGAKGAKRGIEWLHRGGNGVTVRCMEGAQSGMVSLLGAWGACRGCAEGYGWLQ